MSHRRPVLAALSVAALLAALLPAAALALPGAPAGPTVTIDGNQASVTLAAGGVSLDLTLTFEQVVGLNAANLGISARVATPSELVGRLPDNALTSLPAGFPLLVTVEPPASGGLSFSGVASVDVHTHGMRLSISAPLPRPRPRARMNTSSSPAGVSMNFSASKVRCSKDSLSSRREPCG